MAEKQKDILACEEVISSLRQELEVSKIKND
jgi:hypothetical protein